MRALFFDYVKMFLLYLSLLLLLRFIITSLHDSWGRRRRFGPHEGGGKLNRMLELKISEEKRKQNLLKKALISQPQNYKKIDAELHETARKIKKLENMGKEERSLRKP